MFDELPKENDGSGPDMPEPSSLPPTDDDRQRPGPEQTLTGSAEPPQHGAHFPAPPFGASSGHTQSPAPEHGEPDPLTLLGDVLQYPRKAFAYLALPRAERIGLAIVVYVVSQIPANWMRNPFGVEVGTEAARIFGNAVTSVVGLAVAVGFLHIFARLLGGRNTYAKLFQAWAMASLPSLLAAPFLAWDPMVIGGFATSVTGIWSFVLGIIAIREVYGFSTGRALAALFLPVVATFFLIVAFGVLAAMLGLMPIPGLPGL